MKGNLAMSWYVWKGFCISKLWKLHWIRIFEHLLTYSIPGLYSNVFWFERGRDGDIYSTFKSWVTKSTFQTRKIFSAGDIHPKEDSYAGQDRSNGCISNSPHGPGILEYPSLMFSGMERSTSSRPFYYVLKLHQVNPVCGRIHWKMNKNYILSMPGANLDHSECMCI